LQWLENEGNLMREYIDIVFVDNHMNGMDGPETIRHLRQIFGDSKVICGITDDNTGMEGVKCIPKQSIKEEILAFMRDHNL
jgi:CheY-like chemotaxis protein